MSRQKIINDQEEIDFTKLKYALYVRKSREEPEKQIRSIPDQISECKEMAKALHLTVVGDPLVEKKSAKIPGRRPVFRQMLKDIKKGKYNAILAWNPDRLARNMLEGGQIIDMVDQETIVDLKFKTHHFSADANGKMLLGIAFVLSKQYSDKLSQDVKRGFKHKHAEGKSHIYKRGYKRDQYGVYSPDGKNFELIKDAWIMRSEGDSVTGIASYLNDNGFCRITVEKKRKILITKQMLSDMFQDPFYYGILIQSNQSVDLRELYEDFKPATDIETYGIIQMLSRKGGKPFKSQSKSFNPLRRLVKCSFCESHGKHMYVSPSGREGSKKLYFRCDTPGCKRVKKSIRAKVIFQEFIYKFLEDGLKLTEEEYKSYYKNLSQTNKKQHAKIKTEIYSLNGALRHARREIKRLSLTIPQIHDQSIKEINLEELHKLKGNELDLQRKIQKGELKLDNPEEDRLTVEEFLNISKKAGDIVKYADPVIKDTMCRFIFLNIVVDEEKVVSYQLKEPFATLLKSRDVLHCRGH